MLGLGEVELGLVRIVAVHHLVGVVKLHFWTDAVVVANGSKTAVDVVYDFLTVDAELQGHHEVRVAKGGLVGVSHKAEAVAHARGAPNLEARVSGQQASGFRINSVDQVYRAGLQGRGALGCVANVDQFNPVKVTAVGLPVVAGLALEGGTHARLELIQGIGTRAVGLAVVLEAVGNHNNVVVAEVERQVDIAFAHDDLHLSGGELFDFLDVGQQRLGGRFGLAPMHVERVNDIVCIQGFARGEADALAHIENPVGSTRLDFPALEQLTGRVAVVSDFDQVVPEHQAHVDGDGVCIGQWVQAVRR